MIQGIVFLQETGSISMLLMFIVFCSMGFLGMSCFAALTKKFGALTSAITSTTRKGLTLVLSYICFPTDKAITWGHFFGATIFLGGLLLKSIQKGDSTHHHKNNHNNHPLSPTKIKDQNKPHPIDINNNNNNNNNNDIKTNIYLEYLSSFFSNKNVNKSPIQDDGDWNIPFGVKNRIDGEGNKTRRRPIIVVGGSVHCEGEAGGGIGGLGLEIETDEEDDCDDIIIEDIDVEDGISGIRSNGSNVSNDNSNGKLERLNSREKVQQQQQQLEFNQLQSQILNV